MKRGGRALCRAVGAANCGLRHLKEFEVAGPAPALVQLELSPYNQRPAEVAWARGNRAVVTCAAWSQALGRLQLGRRGLPDALNNMQGPRRDEGPDFGAVGLCREASSPCPGPACRTRCSASPSPKTRWRASERRPGLSAREMRSLNQLEGPPRLGEARPRRRLDRGSGGRGRTGTRRPTSTLPYVN